MKWLFFHYDTFLEFERSVTEHQFVLRCMPRTNDRQRVVQAEVKVSPAVPFTAQEDGFGNAVQAGCVFFEHNSFHYSAHGEVFVSPDNKDRCALNPAFAYPSRLTAPTPEMAAFLKALPLEGGRHAVAQAISSAVHAHIAYSPGSTDVHTTAAQVFAGRAGVCQDYAHVFVALARLAGIPARYANGLVLGEGASHAWAEAYIDDGWVGFDPTRDSAVGDDYIRFSVGRDFDDCPIERGVFFGDGGQRQTVQIKVRELSQIDPAPER
ncbi:MAG: transglutaminase family protein [Acidobacteriota bacterium]|jgi:transglutaminase-like putative cysteine protease|nr:transglutaminase family protein [Acidobacteriota bacterium]